jgi:hypothetical protein
MMRYSRSWKPSAPNLSDFVATGNFRPGARQRPRRMWRERPGGWNLICSDGEFDISFHPSGFAGGYAQLIVNAHRLRVGEVEVVVADLADVIRSKESAGRPKDLRVLPLLYRHQSTRGDGKG